MSILDSIDGTLAAVTGHPIGPDAMRWVPEDQAASGLTFPALLIPAEPFDDVRLVDLGDSAYHGAKTLIGCHVIEKLTVDEAGSISADFLFDEEGSPQIRSDAVFNERATHLGYALKLAQMNGQYPAPAGMRSPDLGEQATAWRRYVHLYGPVVVVGADERTGEWVPVPAHLLAFTTEALDLDELA